VQKKAHEGPCVLWSQDEARFPLVPTLHAPLGVKGGRPRGGTWEHKDQVYGVAALNLVTGQLTTRWLEQPARSKAKTGASQQPRLHTTFVTPLQAMARRYAARTVPEGVLTIEKAPGHRGARVEHGLEVYPHLRLDRFPRYSPQRHGIERFWRGLRRRATHNRLFMSRARLRATLRSTISDFQTMRQKVRSLMESPQKAKKEAKLAAA
jgi:hypothetical protein